MSLVAYGGGSDSESSDNEAGDESTSPSSKNETIIPGPGSAEETSKFESPLPPKPSNIDDNISDEEDYYSVSSTSVSMFTVNNSSATATGHLNYHSRMSENEHVNSTTLNSLDDLPAPKTTSGIGNTVEDVLEDEVKAKPSEIANAPKPPGKKLKQPVKITIPSLDMTPEDEPLPSKKNMPSSISRSGLFSLLPAPLHSAKKEINRPLIPHSLTKKPAAPAKLSLNPLSSSSSTLSSNTNSSQVASSSDISLKKMSQFNALTGYDSDSDDDNDATAAESENPSLNFFSIGSSTENNVTESHTMINSTPSISRLQSEEVSSSKPTDSVNIPTKNDYIEGGADGAEEVSRSDEVEEAELNLEPGAYNDAPLQFGGPVGGASGPSRLRAWATSAVATSSQSFLDPVGPGGSVGGYHMPTSAQYNMADYQAEEPSVDTGEVPMEDLKKFMSDKEFRKLQGQRKRGLEETVSFVDANVDDYTDPTEYNKHLTEESSYVSHKKTDNLPTSQQKRKKQITYLAFQAKEKEMELKNQWAMNRQTKMQTQSKYGF